MAMVAITTAGDVSRIAVTTMKAGKVRLPRVSMTVATEIRVVDVVFY